MIGKTVIGRSFKGCVNYNFAKVEKGFGEILDSRGVRDYDRQAMIRDFNSRKALNPKLSRCVWHTALSFQDKLTNSKMLGIAQQWIKGMGLDQTQYVILRHTDTEHHHVHIIANRINDEGITISDSNNWKRSESLCGELIKSFQLSPLPLQRNESKINRHKLNGRDLLKSDINRIIKTALLNSNSVMDFSREMQNRGFQCLIRYNPDHSIRGISFERDGVKIKASDIHKSFSARSIEQFINTNRKVKAENSEKTNKVARWSPPYLGKTQGPLSEDEEEKKRRRIDSGLGQIDL